MDLSEKVLLNLKELKEKTVSMIDFNFSGVLDDEYFVSGKSIKNDNIQKLLNNNICSFQQIVDRLKSIKDMHHRPCLWRLLLENDPLEDSIKNNKLTKEDIKYLLNKIDNWKDLESLCEKISLIKYILKEFVLDKEIIDNLNTVVRNRIDDILERRRKDREYYDSLNDEDKLKYDELNSEYIEDGYWYFTKNGIHDVFDLFEFYATHWEHDDPYDDSCGTWETIREENTDKELLELIEANEKFNDFDLNTDQKSEIYELIQNNEVASKKFEEIIENHIEDNFSFESLMNYLKKREKKNTLNI